jgi:exopolyphosphatase/guanosine-5'-triphosphate,3'-diphosphate pyrophosphatase
MHPQVIVSGPVPIHAIIDIGSNSIKLLVANLAADGNYSVIVDESEVTGLSEGLQPGGDLGAEPMQRTLHVLHEFGERAAALRADRILAAGTSALRDAANSAQFLAQAAEQTGVEIRILSGIEEARLGRLPALRELAIDTDIVLFDTGGGSTELSWITPHEVFYENSLQLGARRMTDAANVQHPVQPAAAEALEVMIAAVLAKDGPAAGDVPGLRIVGIGGTANQAARMLQGKKDTVSIDLPVIAREDLEQLLDAITPMPLEDLRKWPKLSASRAPIIYAGISIILAILRHFDAASYILVDRGLRYGLLLESAALIDEADVAADHP